MIERHPIAEKSGRKENAMCINYVSVFRELLHDIFDTAVPADMEWRDEIYQG